MDKLTREVRKFIYDEFVATSHPPIAQRVADQFEISRSDAVHLFHILEKERQLTLIPGTDRIFMAHPFSAVATPFRCRLRTGREYFINCSFDTLACYATLAGAPMTISSFCHRTGTQIEIMLNCRKVEWFHPEGTVVYLGIPARHWWRNIIDTCGNQFLFFASEAEARLWEQETDKKDHGHSISIETCLNLVEPIYQDKLKLDYQRPTAESLNHHLARLGLHGDFWRY